MAQKQGVDLGRLHLVLGIIYLSASHKHAAAHDKAIRVSVTGFLSSTFQRREKSET